MNKQTRQKGGGELFSKIRELMHNGLSNEKDAVFVLNLDFFEFCAINEV